MQRRDDIPEDVPGNTNQSLGAKLSREAPSIIEVVVNQRRKVHHVLVRIVDPRPRRQRKNSRVLLNRHPNKLDRLRAQEPSPCNQISLLKPTSKDKTHRVRVSVRVPLLGSITVRSRTPFCNPMFMNIVGCDLLMLESNMSAMQMDEGGAVNACILSVSRVVSGSREIMRTV